jgi:hypothetical protein
MSFLQLYKDYREGGKHHCTVAEDEFDQFPCFHCDLASGDCLCGEPEQQGNKCPFCVVRELNELIKDADEMAPAVAEGDGLLWRLAPGGANRREVRGWRWNPLGIGGLAIALALGLALLLQRMRLALGYGLPQLPAGVTAAGDPGRS